MSYFSKLGIPKWEIISSRKLTKEEINEVDRAFVISSDVWFTVEFQLKNGERRFIPAYNKPVYVEDNIDLSKIDILQLEWNGNEESIITRVRFNH